MRSNKQNPADHHMQKSASSSLVKIRKECIPGKQQVHCFMYSVEHNVEYLKTTFLFWNVKFKIVFLQSLFYLVVKEKLKWTKHMLFGISEAILKVGSSS